MVTNMGRFRSAKSQAVAAVKKHFAIGKPKQIKNDGKVHSLGSANTYVSALIGVAKFIQENRLTPNGKGLGDISASIAISYLEMRSQKVGQKALNKDREAMQLLLSQKLPVIKSELEAAKNSRAYPDVQVNLIIGAMSAKHSLSARIAFDAGLRAHELLTLRRRDERAATNNRDWRDDRFRGREGVSIYTVHGKGGLVREIALSSDLAKMLEERRLVAPRIIADRRIFYEQHYDIGGGKQWSDSFTKASQRVLGWTNGGHGLRHSFAQDRMRTLIKIGYCYEEALAVVSQEMGHFRPDITTVYLF